jgi:hypothetical protein
LVASEPSSPKFSKNNTSRLTKQYGNVGIGENEHTGIVQSVYEKLDENPLTTAKDLAKLLDLPYKQYRNYLTKLRSNWKYYHKNERGSKCSNLHCYKGKLVLDRGLSDGCRGVVLRGLEGVCGGCSCLKPGSKGCRGCVGFLGWVPSRAKNKFLIWRGRLGRVTWFTTGTVLLHVDKPGNLGKAKQLFCDAFGSSGLVTDVKILVSVTDGLMEKVGLRSLGVYQKAVHAPYLTNQRLPLMTISDFEESHGITIKVGDRSHPNAVEVIAQFPAQTERLIEQVGAVVRKLHVYEAENLDLKASLGKLMSALDLALGKPGADSKVVVEKSEFGGKIDYLR